MPAFDPETGIAYESVLLFRRNGTLAGRALVDVADVDLVRQHVWHLTGRGYAATNITHPLGGLKRDGVRTRQTALMMHRLILGLGFGDRTFTDHVNRQRCDNRRRNLRIATPALNMQNIPSYRGSTSKYRGVSWFGPCGKWRAEATLDGRRYYFGLYSDEEEAAAVVSAWRHVYMPFTVEEGHLVSN